MSYVVTLKRRDGLPLPSEQVQTAIAGDPEFVTTHVASGRLNAQWRPSPGASPIGFELSQGEISVSTPSNAALRKLQELAAKLDGLVVGEEGEDLTDVAVPAAEATPRAAIGCAAAAILLAAAGLVWLLFRQS